MATASPRGVGGLSLVGHVSVESILPVGSVLDNLEPAVGKLDAVFSTDHISIRYLIPGVVSSEVIILHLVLEVVGHSRFVVVVVMVITASSNRDRAVTRRRINGIW